MPGIQYEIDEVLNEAIMTGVPALIVEGVDDIPIYSQITSKISFKTEIYAVETIQGYSEGCEQVISAITDLNALPNQNYRLPNHILGIIDKDVRDYRGELPQIEPILVLNYYSIESHFVSKSIIEHTLKLCTKANRELITEELVQIIMDEIETKLLDLYYFSLESLRKSLERDYNADFSYSYSCGRINDVVVKSKICSKKDELDKFASNHNLQPNLNALKKITKGKWLIDVFSSELLKSINNLQEKCKEDLIVTCKSCATNAFDKCLYRIREGFTKKTINSLILSNTDSSEFTYIIDRIRGIKTYDYNQIDSCHV